MITCKGFVRRTEGLYGEQKIEGSGQERRTPFGEKVTCKPHRKYPEEKTRLKRLDRLGLSCGGGQFLRVPVRSQNDC